MSRLLSSLLFSLILASTVQAAIVIDFDQSGSGSLGTIDLPGGNTTGLQLQGVADSGALLNFTGNETLLSPSGGQARIEGNDGAFTVLDIRFDNGNLFERIVFNLNADADGNVTITAYDEFLNSTVQVLSLDGSGENFINVQGTGGTRIFSVSIVSSVALEDIRQVRVDNLPDTGISANAIPEPATFGVVGLALAGLALVRTRRR